jgi:hypothetical protein
LKKRRWNLKLGGGWEGVITNNKQEMENIQTQEFEGKYYKRAFIIVQIQAC